MRTKQVIIMRKFSSLRTGKYCAQAAHASLGAFLNCSSLIEENPMAEEYLNRWLYDSFTKITLYVETDEELIEIYQKFAEAKIPCVLIKDNGTTEFAQVSTFTAVGAGPWLSEEIDLISGHLKLF